jgi:RNA polymerase sigma factor (TIGR02999 family)
MSAELSVTRILNAIGSGDARAADELLPLVYEELRKLAAHRMAREQPGQTLQPTALVHEAWLRLVGDANPRFEGRGHFFAAAAEAMRRILIDRARQKLSLKRGARAERVNLDELEVATAADDETLLALDEALARLAREDPDSAQFIKLRFFVGLTNDEAAQALGIPERTARRHWNFARAWLHRELRREAEL